MKMTMINQEKQQPRTMKASRRRPSNASRDPLTAENPVLHIIDFLERLGQDAGLRHVTEAAMENAMRQAGIAPALRVAILNKDQTLLTSLLGADTNVCCLVHYPDPDGLRESEDDGDEDAAKEDKDKTEKSYRRAVDRVA
jgi:hypothetical protein